MALAAWVSVGAGEVKRGLKPHEGLTEKQVEVMELVVLGKTQVEIGMILNLPTMTVKSRMQGAKRKLGAANKTYAVTCYLTEKLKK